MKRRKALIVASVIVLVAAVATFLISSQYFTSNPVLALGKGFEIRRDKLNQVLATAKAQNPVLPPDADIHALTHLIEIQLVYAKATHDEKTEGQKKADEQYATTSKELGDAEVSRRLELTHMTADQVRQMLGEEITAQASLSRQLDLHVTDADARKYFDDHSGAFDEPAKVHVRELLLLTTSDFTTSAAPPLPLSAIQAKHSAIDDLARRIRGGEDFAALARQYNEDPISRNSGGEMTFVSDQVDFGKLALTMKPGQISDALANQDGFRIFQLIENIPAKKGDLATCGERIKNILIGEQKRNLAPGYINRLKAEAAVEIVDPKLKKALAASETEMAANAKRAADAQSAAETSANSPEQKAAEAKAFGSAATRPAASHQ